MFHCVSLSRGASRAEGDEGRRAVTASSSDASMRRPAVSRAKRPKKKQEIRESSPLVGSIVEATSTLMESEEHPDTPVQQRGKGSSLTQTLGGEIRLGKWSMAIETAHSLLSMKTAIDSSLLDLLFQGLCSQGLFRKAIQLYNRLGKQKRLLAYRTFHFFIQSALKDGAFVFAIKLYKGMKESGYSVNEVTYCMLLTGLQHDKRKGSRSHTSAYEIWDGIKNSNCRLDAALFRAGCGACVAVGKLEEAEQLIPIMREKGFRPDGRFYNILIKGYCQTRNMKSALKCYEQMKAAGVLPERVTYNTLIQGFILKNEVENGERMLKFAISEGCRPDVWSYTSLMKGYSKSKRTDDALRLLEEFQSQGGKPNKVTYGVLVDAYVEERRMDLAQMQFEAMKKSGLQPNRIIYNTLLKGYASDAESSKEPMIQLLGEMKRQSIYPGVDTLNTLLAKMANLKNSAEAVVTLFNAIVELGFLPDAVSYTYLLKAARQERNVERCRQIFAKMESSAAIEVDLVCWNLMVSVFAESGDMEDAEEMLQGAVQYAQKRNLRIPVEAFGAIIQGYVQRRNLPSAITKFRWFCKLGGQPDAGMLETLLEACIIKRDMQHALKILRATELLDKKIDLTKYRTMLRQMEQEIRQWKSGDNEENNLGLERVKFWLGMPNSYYSSDWP